MNSYVNDNKDNKINAGDTSVFFNCNDYNCFVGRFKTVCIFVISSF